MKTNEKNKLWRVIFWSLLDSGNNAPFIFMLSFFLVFNNESFGISAVIVGIMMTVSRLFDAVTDPIIGLSIDKTNTKFGKYRPNLIIGAIIMNASFVAMFWGPEFSSTGLKIGYMTVFYILHIIGYTFVTATFKSGNTIITTDAKQRSKQGLYMMIGTTVIAIFIMAGTVPILTSLGGIQEASSWRTFSLVVVGINLFFVFMAGLAIASRDNNQYYVVQEKQPKIKEFTPILKENRPLRMLIVAAATNKLASTTVTTVLVYWFMIVMDNLELQSTMSMISLPISILAAIGATILAVKTSKKFTMIVGSWASIAVLVSLIVIRPFEPDQLILYIILAGAAAAFGIIANAQVNVMIADTADYELWKTGKSIPGMISTTFSFVDKITSSASGLLVGGVIGYFGYTQGATVTSGLYWSVIGLYLIIPILGHIASLWAMKRYELDRVMNQRIANDLAERRSSEEVAS